MDKYVSFEPASTPSPLILSMPHSASPATFSVADTPSIVTGNLRISDDVKKTICRVTDIGVPPATNFHQQPYARIHTRFPRAFVDVNRATTDIDSLSVEGRGDPAHAHGVIWRSTVLVTDDLSDIPGAAARIQDMLQRPYTQTEFAELVQLAHEPYHKAIRDVMRKTRETVGVAVLLDLHTFPPHIATKIPPGYRHSGAFVLGPKARRGRLRNIREGEMPDLIAIVNSDAEGRPQSCHPKILEIIRDTFEEAGLIVDVGFGPFRGDNGSTILYANPREGSHVVGLEFVSHDLGPNHEQGSLEVNEREAAQLRPIFTQAFERIAALQPADLKS